MKTEFIYHQKPTETGKDVKSDLNRIVKSGYLECFGLDNVEWFVREIMKIQSELNYCFNSKLIDLVECQKELEIIWEGSWMLAVWTTIHSIRSFGP